MRLLVLLQVNQKLQLVAQGKLWMRRRSMRAPLRRNL